MQRTTIAGLDLYYPASEAEAAELVGDACQRTVALLRREWGLKPPADCRVYVMTGWLRFLFHSAPWVWRIMIGLTLPFWARRISGLWKVAGGWAQRYGSREAIGIKPPRLLQAADRSMGDQLFIRHDDMAREVQQVTCHELAHAFVHGLQLPTWLHEGLSMIAVDRLVGEQTVRSDTLERLANPKGMGTGGQQKLRLRDPEAVLDLYIRGYWLTRYIEQERPGLLRDLFVLGHVGQVLEAELLAALDAAPDFWDQIDARLIETFG